MTTPIAPGDIVLRNGRAFEVCYVSGTGGLIAIDQDQERHRPDGILPLIKVTEVTRIGSTADGWRVHSGSERPVGVEADARLQLVFANGARKEDTDSSWSWEEKGYYAIVAYRIVHRAERAEGPGVNTDAVTDSLDREAELRKVAAEMRVSCKSELWRHSARNMTVLEWANVIDPPAPEPLKCGDRVRTVQTPHSDLGTVLVVTEDGLGGVESQVVTQAGNGAVCVNYLSTVERIP